MQKGSFRETRIMFCLTTAEVQFNIQLTHSKFVSDLSLESQRKTTTLPPYCVDTSIHCVSVWFSKQNPGNDSPVVILSSFKEEKD